MVAINPRAWKHTLERAKIQIKLQGELPHSPCHIDEDNERVNLCAGGIIVREYMHCYADKEDIKKFITDLVESKDIQLLLDVAQNCGLPVDIIHDIISLNNGLSPKTRVNGLIEYLELLSYKPEQEPDLRSNYLK